MTQHTAPPGGPPVEEAFPPEQFRRLMSTFPSGVAVVTALGEDGAPYGMTVSSLCSVSLDPAMLLVCLRTGSETLGVLHQTGAFAVNLLQSNGEECAARFSSREPRRFSGIAWEPTPRWSLPALRDHAHTTVECVLHQAVEAGDHTIVTGRVDGTVQLDAQPRPLVYGLRRYAEWPGPDAGEEANVPGVSLEARQINGNRRRSI
ncbi:flavin reductase family protein [Streptomyces albidus (ex Kaewkla and Franco 2022)]|uniref:flavin reductase family protein n=1 Tax=Streptomyces albidus (ex Kaewkla and Franco 2022) TaxID=722709 RepID=UPI002814D279|nr:flavin reductase family protein [Streptomyces albidus (ex Kaewkla and Franco 2022)]